MRLEVALEVEDLELIRLREREELAEGRIGLDNLLLHELVVARIGADTARDIAAAEESALADTEELAERLRDLNGLLEDRALLLGRLRAIGVERDRAAAAALLGLLELTRNLLLEFLHVAEDRAERGTERVDRLDERGELRDDVDVNGGRGRRCGDEVIGRRNYGGGGDGRNYGGGRGLGRRNDGSNRGLRRLGGRGGRGGRNRRNSRNRRDGGRGDLGLGGLGRAGLLGGGGGECWDGSGGTHLIPDIWFLILGNKRSQFSSFSH